MKSALKYLLPLLLLPSAAAATTYSDRATFDAAVNGVVNDDLNARPNGAVTTLFGVETISSGSYAGGGYINTYGQGFGQTLGAADAGGSNNFDSLIFTFHAPIFAFGFDDVDLSGGTFEYANVIVTLADNSVHQYSFTDPDFDFTTAAFFGYSSDIALSSIEIWSSDNPGDAPGVRPNQIDNLAISRIPTAGGGVPEPASWALMITGFGLAGTAMRRRRLSAAKAA